MLDTLDTLIATIGVVLVLSLVVQAIQQIFKQSLDLKSGYMRAELLALFDPSGKVDSGLGNVFGLRALAQKKAAPIAKTIVDQLEQAMASFGMKDLHLLEGMSPQDCLKIVKSLPAVKNPAVKTEVAKALDGFDHWFDVSKKAFQEHYERRMKYWSYLVSFAVVLVLNADLFQIYREFSQSKSLRDAGVAMAQNLVPARDTLLALIQVKEGKQDTTWVQKSNTAIANDIAANFRLIERMGSSMDFQIMGWNESRTARMFSPFTFMRLLESILGWLCTTLLVSLGAPFWYDVLKSVMGVKDRLKQVRKTP